MSASTSGIADIAAIAHVQEVPTLDGVADFLTRFVIFPNDHALYAMTLWIAHTWRMDAWETTPRMVIVSADMGSGKTRLQEAAEFLAHNVSRVTSGTAGYVAGMLGREPKPTIFFDEIDTVYGKNKGNEDLRAILNGGYRKNNLVGRGGWADNQLTTSTYDPFGALLLAGLGTTLPGTVLDRAIVIRLKKRGPDDRIVESWRIKRHQPEAQDLGARLGDWMNSLEFTDEEPQDMPVEDRAADIWEPLVMIADVAGGEWPSQAREAARFFTSQNREIVVPTHVQLIWDIKRVFEDTGESRITTELLISALCRLPESRWRNYNFNGNPIADRQVARLVGEFEIKSKDIATASGTRKGYEAGSFMDAWSRHPQQAPPPSEGDERDERDNGCGAPQLEF